jgi:vacuole morphology and inheritance protein 14
MTRECVQVQNTTQIQKLLRVLGTDFAMSQSPNMRKGGLIGLAAMSIGLGKETGRYVSELVKPIVSCMGDSDSRVRFYACESLYNVTKVARNDVLPMFNDIFTSMSTVVTDLDQSVRTAAELMDRLLKDIITEHEHFKVNWVTTYETPCICCSIFHFILAFPRSAALINKKII